MDGMSGSQSRPFIVACVDCRLFGENGSVKSQSQRRWTALLPALACSCSPPAVVSCYADMSRRGKRMLQLLNARGLLPPTGICAVCATKQDIQEIWDAAGFVDRLLVTADELLEFLEKSKQKSGVSQVTKHLLIRLNVVDPVVRSFIQLHVTDPETTTLSPEVVAGRLEIGRSTLYRCLKRCGLAPVGQWQMLFRLVKAIEVLQQDGSAEDAAYIARLADGRSLRRSLKHHLGASVIEARSRQDWQWVVDCWLERHGAFSPGTLKDQSRKPGKPPHRSRPWSHPRHPQAQADTARM